MLDDVLRGVLLDLHAADGGVGATDTGIEQTHVFIDLRRGAYRRTGVAADHTLLDGDGGRKTFDEVAFGLAHTPKKLPGIRGETLHVAALAFCIQGVEGQRRFAASTHAGYHDKLVVGDVDVDVLEIIDAGAFDFDLVSHCVWRGGG